jgi:hypothetical protein
MQPKRQHTRWQIELASLSDLKAHRRLGVVETVRHSPKSMMRENVRNWSRLSRRIKAILNPFALHKQTKVLLWYVFRVWSST